jgi:glycosyltransferase involved in cell wall biosynthesis
LGIGASHLAVGASHLRIGIDYLPAVSHAPGVGRYARELVRALVRLEDRPDLALFEVGTARAVMDERSLGLTIGDPRVRRVKRRISRRLLRWLPPQLGAADRVLGGVDVFHHVLLDVPRVARARQTLALSELPADGTPADERLRALLPSIDGVLVFTSAYQHALPARYGIQPARTHRVHVGCEHWRRELSEMPAREKPPLVLVLGALRSSRRHVAILHAFEILLARGIEATLLAIGADGNATAEFRERLAASKAQAHVMRFQSRAESDMPELVARASALVQLEDDAGTPVTPLEAFAVGVPVVASRLAAFEEALGGRAELVDNDEVVREPARLADALERAIAGASDENARTLRMQVAAQFTWERNARETLDVWRKLASVPP